MRVPEITVVGIATDGADAVKQTFQFSPDVVLMDIQMPIMDGIQATRIIRQERPHAQVLVLTVLAEDKPLFDALKAGARGYLLKNSTSDEIVQAIRSVAAGEAVLPPAQARRVLAEFELLSRQRTALQELFEKLSKAEINVLSYLVEGKSNPQISRALFIAEKTVKDHISSILKKLEVNSRLEAAEIARRSGLSGPASR
jgi:DNA-binding NarL/FixJ family response regulator